MRNDRFGKRGVFTCSACGRKTREAGDNVECCPDCYDLAGIFNVLQDGGDLTPYRSRVEGTCRAIVAKGGRLDSDAQTLLNTLGINLNDGDTKMETQNSTTTTTKPAKAPRKTEKVALKSICSQMKIDPKAARRKLRKSDLGFHSTKDRWMFTESQAAKVREILKESDIERQTKQ